MASPVAIAIFDEVCCNGIEPRRESLPRVKLRTVLIDADKGFLGEILGAGKISAGAIRHRADHGLVFFDDSPESFPVTRAGLLPELVVGDRG